MHVDEYGNEYRWKSDNVEPTMQVKDLMNIIKTPIEEEVASSTGVALASSAWAGAGAGAEACGNSGGAGSGLRTWTAT